MFLVTFPHDRVRASPLLLQAPQSDTLYIGVQGRRSGTEQQQHSLFQIGATRGEIARLVAPIGLIPSMRDDRTLAISVLAEVIAKDEQQA